MRPRPRGVTLRPTSIDISPDIACASPERTCTSSYPTAAPSVAPAPALRALPLKGHSTEPPIPIVSAPWLSRLVLSSDLVRSESASGLVGFEGEERKRVLRPSARRMVPNAPVLPAAALSLEASEAPIAGAPAYCKGGRTVGDVPRASWEARGGEGSREEKWE